MIKEGCLLFPSMVDKQFREQFRRLLIEAHPLRRILETRLVWLGDPEPNEGGAR